MKFHLNCTQKYTGENADLDCIRCLRSFHFFCLKTESPSDTKTELTEEFRNSYICHWCHSFEFVKVGQYANGKLGGNKWYPCKVISNEDYPYKDPNLGTVGYVAVQWLPYRNKLFYNVMPHNRVIEMYEKDYFYVLDASKSHCEEEWDEAQEHVIANCPQNFPPKDDQVVFGYSNGHKVSMISKNIFTEKETQFDSDDFREALTECTCKEDDAERCGPKSGCINRALFSECPENCGQKNGVCLNHEVSNHQQKKVEIFRTSDRGFGIKAKEPIPKGTFIGEYIGEVITEKEKNRRLEDIGRWGNIEAQFYILMFDKKRYIDAQFKGNEMRYVNHSCEPNADVRQIRCKRSFHMCLYSLRDINIDEEITFDYKMGKFLEDIPLPICRCKAETCEGVMCGTKYKRPKKNEIREEPSTSTASLQQDRKSGHQKSQKEKIRKKTKLNSSKEMNKMAKKKSIKKNGKSSTNKENILLQLEPLQNIISKKINRRRKSDEMASLKVEFPLDVLSSIPVSSNGNSPRLEVISVKSDLTPEPAKMTPRKITTPKNTPLKDYNFRNRSCLEKEILDSPEISPMPMKISSSRLGASAALIGEEFKVPKKKGRSRRIETSQKENLEPPSKRYNFRSSSSLEVEI
uniref:Uncharacterized protein n=1 Tax=Acrobeloides nanus TaxID=290746 RepID=A0A914BUD5_9BILA